MLFFYKVGFGIKKTHESWYATKKEIKSILGIIYIYMYVCNVKDINTYTYICIYI